MGKIIKEAGLTPQEWFNKYKQLAMGVSCGAIEMRSRHNPEEILTLKNITPYTDRASKGEEGVVVVLRGIEADELGIAENRVAINTWMRKAVSLGLRAENFTFREISDEK